MSEMLPLIFSFFLALLVWHSELYALPIAKALVRQWVRIYTSPLPVELRERRREEMESELWEQQRDGKAEGLTLRAIALRLTYRLIFGIPADIAWAAGRIKRPAAYRAMLARTSLGLFAVAVLPFGFVWWIRIFVGYAAHPVLTAFFSDTVVLGLISAILGIACTFLILSLYPLSKFYVTDGGESSDESPE